MSSVRVTLADGTPALLRPIRTDEGPTLAAALERLSPESRVRRFLYDKGSLSEKELHDLTHCDGINHIALVGAVLDANGEEREPIGVARAIRADPASDRAEVACVVADDWQGLRMGSALLEELARRCVALGMRRWRAVYFSGNKPTRKLLNRVGEVESSEAVGAGVVDVTVVLRASG